MLLAFLSPGLWAGGLLPLPARSSAPVCYGANSEICLQTRGGPPTSSPLSRSFFLSFFLRACLGASLALSLSLSLSRLLACLLARGLGSWGNPGPTANPCGVRLNYSGQPLRCASEILPLFLSAGLGARRFSPLASLSLSLSCLLACLLAGGWRLRRDVPLSTPPPPTLCAQPCSLSFEVRSICAPPSSA